MDHIQGVMDGWTGAQLKAQEPSSEKHLSTYVLTETGAGCKCSCPRAPAPHLVAQFLG